MTLNQLLAAGRPREALEEATRRLTRNPQDDEALLISAKVAVLERRAEQAEQWLGRVKAPAMQPEVTILRGLLALYREDWATACTHFESLTRKPSPPSDAWHGLGIALLGLGKAQKAREAHERAVALDPKNFAYHFELGRVLVPLNENRAAMHQFLKALRLEPRDDRAYWSLAFLLDEQGKKRSALRVLAAGLKHNPQSKRLRDALGSPAPTAPPAAEDPNAALIQKVGALIEQRRNRDARKLLEEAAAQGKRSVSLKFLEATACQGLLPPDVAGALKAYEEAIALEPTNWALHTHLGTFLLEEGNRYQARALEALEKARELSPHRPESMLNLALGYMRAKRRPEALTLAQDAVSRLAKEDPQYAQAVALLESLR